MNNELFWMRLNSNTTATLSAAETAYSSEATEFTTVF